MTRATERLFVRLEREGEAYSDAGRPYVMIGALKSTLEILAQKFPEVEAYISGFEDWHDRNQ